MYTHIHMYVYTRTHTPHLLYPFIIDGQLRLLPCLGYYKQCCYTHLVYVLIFFQVSFHLFWVICPRMKLLDHKVTLFLVFVLFCSPQWMQQFTLQTTVRNIPFSPHILCYFIICRGFNDGHFDWSEVTSHCSFSLFFSNYQL